MTKKHFFVGVRTKVRRYIQNLTKNYRERSVVRFPLGTVYRADSLRTGIKTFSDKSFQAGAQRGLVKAYDGMCMKIRVLHLQMAYYDTNLLVV